MAPLTFLLGFFLSCIATLVPTMLWSGLIWWCDRYEREPLSLLLGAFLWGALPAVILALAFELLLDAPMTQLGSELASEVASSSLIAPIVEELVKGVALLLIVLLGRNEFDDVLDGILYGALIGFGFAMTENLLYFLGALAEGGWANWGVTVVLRGVVFGLNHAIFTACTGAGIGYTRAAQSRVGRLAAPVLGLGAAILLHMFHNLGAALASVSVVSVLISLFNGVGGVVLVSAMLVLAWRREGRWLRSGLAEEVGGLLTEADYTALLSLVGRRQMVAAARRSGGAAAVRAAQRFQELASELAFRKVRLHLRPGDHALARQVAELRTQLAAVPRA